VKQEGIGALAFIPLTVKGELIGKFMTYYRTPHIFSDAEVSLAVTIARQLAFSLERVQAEDRRRQAEEDRELLLGESRHRIKNTLATVQAIAGQTLRHTPPGERQAIVDRLQALGEAHELLTSANWDQAALRDVVERALAPFQRRQSDRFIVDGPTVRLPAATALTLTLCMHELATNAAKYGALSNGTGRVHIVWQPVGHPSPNLVRLSWRESGGPAVSVPERKGFGSVLIEQSFGEDGKVLDFQPDGLRCTLAVML